MKKNVETISDKRGHCILKIFPPVGGTKIKYIKNSSTTKPVFEAAYIPAPSTNPEMEVRSECNEELNKNMGITGSEASQRKLLSNGKLMILA